MNDDVLTAFRVSTSEQERELACWCDALAAEVKRLTEERRLISVHEDVPPLGEEVLILLFDGRFEVAYRAPKFGLWLAKERPYEDFEVTHWQRLPEKPSTSS